MNNTQVPAADRKIITKKILLFAAIITYTTALGLPVLLEIMAL